MGQVNRHIFKKLESDILRIQGFKSGNNKVLDVDLGVMAYAFPNRSFPTSAVHEFITSEYDDSASTTGFIAGFVSKLIGKSGAALWVGKSNNVFPPALKKFGVDPERVVFANMKNDKGVAWAMEESLKCSALSAVVGEMKNLDFTTSRRLQLAVEQSKVTGFVIRKYSRKINPTACVSRWKIRSIASEDLGIPGVGFPTWKVELLKIRNGHPDSWIIQWEKGRFNHIHLPVDMNQMPQMKVG